MRIAKYYKGYTLCGQKPRTDCSEHTLEIISPVMKLYISCLRSLLYYMVYRVGSNNTSTLQ